jgi:hypothetical protein
LLFCSLLLRDRVLIVLTSSWYFLVVCTCSSVILLSYVSSLPQTSSNILVFAADALSSSFTLSDEV